MRIGQSGLSSLSLLTIHATASTLVFIAIDPRGLTNSILYCCSKYQCRHCLHCSSPQNSNKAVVEANNLQ